MAIQVGDPKFLLPASENTCPFNFLSFVHRTTSHGGDGVSISPASSSNWLLRDALLLWPGRNAGDEGRGERVLGEYIRDWNLRSKGLKDGVGLFKPGLDATEGRTLLLGDDITEPYIYSKFSIVPTYKHHGVHSPYLNRWGVAWDGEQRVDWTASPPRYIIDGAILRGSVGTGLGLDDVAIQMRNGPIAYLLDRSACSLPLLL